MTSIVIKGFRIKYTGKDNDTFVLFHLHTVSSLLCILVQLFITPAFYEMILFDLNSPLWIKIYRTVNTDFDRFLVSSSHGQTDISLRVVRLYNFVVSKSN